MKDRNKKLFVLVGALLLVVGVSFAYFVSTALSNGEGGKVNATTAKINSATLDVRGTLTFNDPDIYPGHKTISGIEVTATGGNEFVAYNLVWKGTNSLNTPLNFVVYKTDGEVNTTATCNKITRIENGAQILTEECSISNLSSLGSPIYNGTINKGQEKVVLSNAEFITASTTGNKAYYYVVLEYPNLETEQNNDIGGSFNGNVTVEENKTSADITIASIYKQNDTGYAKVQTIPTQEERYVFNTGMSGCTNSAIPIWNTASWSLQVNSLTVRGTDCSLYFDKYVDTENPIISNLATTVTKNEINVTVTASDNEGVTEYWYAIDSDNYTQETSSTPNRRTFGGLTAGSTHTIKVYVKDEAGNPSDISTKEVTTVFEPVSASTIIAAIKSTAKTTEPDFSQIADTDEGVFRVEDGMYTGYSYYWRGAVLNNHIIFADKCWRIVRINGDDTIRLIYNGAKLTGDKCTGNGVSNSGSTTGAVTGQKYNAKTDNSSYVGWTYTLDKQRPTNNATGTASTAKSQTDSWFTSTVTGTNVDKVVDGKFCNDRETGPGGVTTNWSATGPGFIYAPTSRSLAGEPTLACSSSDVYTLKAGALTSDEGIYAGGTAGTSNTSYYLYNYNNYWTMSPRQWANDSYGTTVSVFLIAKDGMLGGASVSSTINKSSTVRLRPVINLTSDIMILEGNGTQDKPYVVE